MDDKTQDLNNLQDSTQSLFSGDETISLSQTGEKYSKSTQGKHRCMGCMELCDEADELCPYCGYVRYTQVEQPIHIIPGTILDDKYMIGRVLGYGGFGVTYIGWDLTLQRKIAIKEYLPSEFSTRAYGQTRVTVFCGEKSDSSHREKKSLSMRQNVLQNSKVKRA